MPDFLATILRGRREDVAAAQRTCPLAELQQRAYIERDRRRPFARHLAETPPPALIAEIKRASPSRGPLAPDLDPAALARAYEEGGAAALSVLTEPHFFRGSPADLQAARSATTLPVLRKDFLFCEYQIWESLAMGADAVLLIVRLLDPVLLKDLFALATELGLDAVVEAAAPEETERAVALGASLIALNARDLQTFEVDPDRPARLAPPPRPGQTVIAASGIGGPEDIRRLRDSGLTAFLVGESLVRASDPAEAVRRLRKAWSS